MVDKSAAPQINKEVFDREVMAITQKAKPHHGKRCQLLRAVVMEDDAWDEKVAKSVVRLEGGTEIVLLNDEVRG